MVNQDDLDSRSRIDVCIINTGILLMSFSRIAGMSNNAWRCFTLW